MNLTLKQAAERVGVSEGLVYLWCSQRVLPHHHLGGADKHGRILIELGDLDRFVADAKVEAAAYAGCSRSLKHLMIRAPAPT